MRVNLLYTLMVSIGFKIISFLSFLIVIPNVLGVLKLIDREIKFLLLSCSTQYIKFLFFILNYILSFLKIKIKIDKIWQEFNKKLFLLCSGQITLICELDNESFFKY